MAVGLIIFLLVYHAFVLYIGWNVWKGIKAFRPDLRRRWLVALSAALLLAAWSMFARFRFSEYAWPHWAAGVWLTFAYLMVFILPLTNIVVLLFRIFSRIDRRRLTRRATLTAAVLTLLAGAYGVYSAYSPVVRAYDVRIDKPALDGRTEMKIVMAADTHFGALSGPSHAKRLVRLINEQQPDLVLFPGDLVDDDIVQYVKQGIPEILRGIEAPVYASLGNHDRLEAGDTTLIRTLEDSGMTLLYDEVTSEGLPVTLIGRKDRTDAARLSVAELARQADPASPLILLDHQPYELELAAQAGIDLEVSGHTHRGQIFPANFITNRIYENDWGYLQKGKMDSIVTSGYGFWGLPFRIGTRSELVVIDVSFK
ncbi:metallophosphoesterase [Saccharibacillus sp. CPCC 101409]|uniref:metallophosphoesterase n=1 Tax=Saccharibacillus sp. CPCC 101409 TaxID=3058041 RepID=UPI002670E48D|nr:metallophosphoesterase [Saccharibacillus sp. CPCC 101409]MDO3411324.1 metallophosphoesterase [Saccharibacillus sp. CPCC 101409]